MDSYDVIVIGTGTAAQVVSSRVRRAGQSLAIIYHRPFGGTCACGGPLAKAGRSPLSLAPPSICQADFGIEISIRSGLADRSSRRSAALAFQLSSLACRLSGSDSS